MNAYRLHGGTLLTEKGMEQTDLLLRDGKILGFLPQEQRLSEDFQEIDCRGLYISPGFVDIHQHGGGGRDYMDSDPDTYRVATEAHLAHGTTSLMPTSLSADTGAMLRAVERYRKAEKDPAIRCHLLGLHMEGPYISAKQAGAQKPEHIRAFDEREYRTILEAAEGHIRRWSVAPEVPGAEKFAEIALQSGVTLSIAHSDADLDTVERAFHWGFRHITHFYSCMSTITRKGGFRVPGVLEAGYYLEDMDIELIADGCHIPTVLLSYAANFKDHRRIALVTDAMRAAGENTRESFLGSREDPLPVIVEDGVAKLTDRSAFAGSVATSDRLVRNMLRAGVTLPEAVEMVTANPLRMMNLQVNKGRLRPGFDGDVCVFNGEIQVKKVFCGGVLAVE